jgi:hypothetical protein
MDVCTPWCRTGSAGGEDVDGRLCRRSAMELREERARDSLVRERASAVVSARPDEPASCRPYSEERRRRGFLRWVAGLEWSCGV